MFVYTIVYYSFMENKALQSVVCVYKPLGMTPLEAIAQFKEQYPAYSHHMISYAGRLDPMAEGLLLLLVKDENKQRSMYEVLRKTYVFEILLGLQTDTYDLLGKLTRASQSHCDDDDTIQQVLRSFTGKQLQPYPPYSSRTVQGKPLYWWARNDRLGEITIPKKEIEIYSISLRNQTIVSAHDLQQTIFDRIALINGNFRQEIIQQTWDTFFSLSIQQSFSILSCEVLCSSGTYVRGIANTLGEKLGCGALAYSIKRTTIGNYSLDNAISLTPQGP